MAKKTHLKKLLNAVTISKVVDNPESLYFIICDNVYDPFLSFTNVQKHLGFDFISVLITSIYSLYLVSWYDLTSERYSQNFFIFFTGL